MKAFRKEPESAERGQVEISDELGYVWIEAYDLAALDAVMCAINAYDAHLDRIAELEGQVEALAGACESFVGFVGEMWPGGGKLNTSDLHQSIADARALVRGVADNA